MRLDIKFLLIALVFTMVMICSFGSNMSQEAKSYAYIMSVVLLYLFGLNQKEFDILNPYHGISVLHILYSSAAVLYAAKNMSIPYGDYISNETADYFLIICFVSQLGIVVGNFAHNRLKFNYRAFDNEFNLDGGGGFSVLIFLFIILCLTQLNALDIFNTVSYADRVLDDNLTKRSVSTSGLVDFYNICSQTLLVYMSLYFIHNKNASLLVRWASFIVIFLLFAKYVLSGDRANAVMVFVCILAYVNYFVSRVSIRSSLVITVIGYIAFNALSILRNTSNPLAMIGIFTEYYSDIGLEFLSIDKSGELQAGSNLLKLVKEVDFGGQSFLFGANAFQSVMTFIPRFLIDQRPEFGNVNFVRQFYPETYAMGGGNGYFLPMDGYWDFGVFGVFVLMLIYSIFCIKVYFKFLRSGKNTLTIFLYSIFYSQMIIFSMRSGVYAAVKSFMVYAFGVFFLILLFALLKMACCKFRKTDTVEPLITFN